MPDAKNTRRPAQRVQDVERFRDHLDALLSGRFVSVSEGDSIRVLTSEELLADLIAFAAANWSGTAKVLQDLLDSAPAPRLLWIATEIGLAPSVLVRSKSKSQAIAERTGAAGVVGLRVASTPLLGAPNWTSEFAGRTVKRRGSIRIAGDVVPEGFRSLVQSDETGMWRGGASRELTLPDIWHVIDYASEAQATLALELKTRSAFLQLVTSETERRVPQRPGGLRVVERALDMTALAKSRPGHALDLERSLRTHIVMQASRYLEILNRLKRSIESLRSSNVGNSEKHLDLWAELVALSWFEFGDEANWLQTLQADRISALYERMIEIERHPATAMVESVLKRNAGRHHAQPSGETSRSPEWKGLEQFPRSFGRQRPFRDGEASLVGAWIEQLGGFDAKTLRSILDRAETDEQRLWVLIGAVNSLDESLARTDLDSILAATSQHEQMIVLGVVVRRLRKAAFESEIENLKMSRAVLARLSQRVDSAAEDARTNAPWLPSDLWAASARVSESVRERMSQLQKSIEERVQPAFLDTEEIPAGMKPRTSLQEASALLTFDATRGPSNQRTARRDFQAGVLWALQNDQEQVERLLRSTTLPPEVWTALWEVGIALNERSILKTVDRFIGLAWPLQALTATLVKQAPGLAVPPDLSSKASEVLMKTLRRELEAAENDVTRAREIPDQIGSAAEAFRELRERLSRVLIPLEQWIEQLREVERDATQTRR